MAGIAVAQSKADWQDCRTVSIDVVLPACTRIIDNPRTPKAEVVRALVKRATSYQKRGDYDRAIADMDRAVALAPGDAESYLTRGEAYHEKHNAGRAIADYDKAISQPDFARAYNGRGWHYDSSNDHQRAGKDFDKAIALLNALISRDPARAEDYNIRGDAYVGKKDYDRAIADFDRAI